MISAAQQTSMLKAKRSVKKRSTHDTETDTTQSAVSRLSAGAGATPRKRRVVKTKRTCRDSQDESSEFAPGFHPKKKAKLSPKETPKREKPPEPPPPHLYISPAHKLILTTPTRHRRLARSDIHTLTARKSCQYRRTADHKEVSSLFHHIVMSYWHEKWKGKK